jgi:hypothetical protein
MSALLATQFILSELFAGIELPDKFELVSMIAYLFHMFPQKCQSTPTAPSH